MELLLYCAAFTLWQCLVFVPSGAVVLGTRLGSAFAVEGPGLRLGSPWPWDRTLVLDRGPIAWGNGALRAEEPLAGPLAPRRDDPPREATLETATRIEARGAIVRIDGRPFARTASPARAASLARGLAALAGVEPARRPTCCAAAEAGRLSVEAFRAAEQCARRGTRALRAVTAAYLCALFVLPPIAVRTLGAEAAWWRLLPLLLALHVASLGALLLARRTLGPLGGELWITAALYPPALLRSANELASRVLSSFHPAAAAAAWLGDEDWLRMLRRELGRLGAPGDRQEEPQRTLREHLLALCDRRGLPRARVLAPERDDPSAASFCPRCLDEFLVAAGTCGGCGAPSVAYPARGSA